MRYEISVVICTHNPRKTYLNRVLDSLKTQTLPLTRWELIVVDNASHTPLVETLDLRWHPRARVVVEPRLGKVWAIKRGASEAISKIVAYLDDDTVADVSFLANALRHFRDHAGLGCAGPGRILPDFQTPPSPLALPHLHMLALLDISTDRISSNYEVIPPGAGLICRKDAMTHYFHVLETDARRSFFGTKGGTLFRAEDNDLVMMIIAQGMSAGQFVDLQLTHLIPSERLTDAYLLRLTRANGASSLLLKWAWDAHHEEMRPWWREILQLIRIFRLPSCPRRYALAFWRGERDAKQIIRTEVSSLPIQ